MKTKKFISIITLTVIIIATTLFSNMSSEAASTSTGWAKDSSGDWIFIKSDGSKAKAEWVNGYWLSPNGKWTYKYRGSWKQNSKGWWYGDSTGWYAKYQWSKINYNWYFFDKAGYITTGWKKINNVWYYFDKSGAMVTGWKKISGKWYYFNTSGKMLTGLNKINSKMYYFDKNGAMLINQYISDKTNTYYINKSGVATIHNHKYEVVDSREATCSTDGYIIKKCACGDTIKETIKKDSNKHTWTTIHNDATCSTKGNHKVYCTSCGEIAEEYEIEKDPTNHKNTTTTITAKEATCTEPGRTANVYCNDCHTTITESTEIPATGHTLVHHAAKAATCTEDGNVEYWTCSICNEMLLTNNAFSNEYVASAKINALGHNFAEEVMYRQNATCHRNDMTTDKPINYDEIKDQYMAGYGYSKWKCSRCGKFEFRIDTNKKPIAHNHGDSEPVNIEYAVSDTSSEWNKSKVEYETTCIAPKELARSEKGREALKRYVNDEFDFGYGVKYYGADYTYEELIKVSDDILPIWVIDHGRYTSSAESEKQFMEKYDLKDLGTTHTETVYEYTAPYIENDEVTYKCQVCGENYTTTESRVVYPANCYQIRSILFSPNGFIIFK